MYICVGLPTRHYSFNLFCECFFTAITIIIFIFFIYSIYKYHVLQVFLKLVRVLCSTLQFCLALSNMQTNISTHEHVFVDTLIK